MLIRTICIIRKIAKNNRNIYHLYIPEVMRPLGKRVLLTYAPLTEQDIKEILVASL